MKTQLGKSKQSSIPLKKPKQICLAFLIVLIPLPFLLPSNKKFNNKINKDIPFAEPHSIEQLQYLPSNIINDYINYYFDGTMFYPLIDDYNNTLGEINIKSTVIGYHLIKHTNNRNNFESNSFKDAFNYIIELQSDGFFKNSMNESITYEATLYALKFFSMCQSTQLKSQASIVIKNITRNLKHYILPSGAFMNINGSDVNSHNSLCYSTQQVVDILNELDISISWKTKEYLGICAGLIQPNPYVPSINDTFYTRVMSGLYSTIFYIRQSVEYCSIPSILFVISLILFVLFFYSLKWKEIFNVISYQLLFSLICLTEYRCFVLLIVLIALIVKDKSPLIASDFNMYYMVFIPSFISVIVQRLFTSLFLDYHHITISLCSFILSQIILSYSYRSSLNQDTSLYFFYIAFLIQLLLTFHSPFSSLFTVYDSSSFLYLQVLPSFFHFLSRVSSLLISKFKHF